MPLAGLRCIIVCIYYCLTCADSSIAGCASYPSFQVGKMFWTAGQRVDLSILESPFVWKPILGDGASMSEMRYTYWSGGETNNGGNYDANLRPSATLLAEKCMQLARDRSYRWNDGLCEIPTCSVCEIDL